FPYLESMANQSFGMVLGKGGADTIIRALAGMVTAAGGKIPTIATPPATDAALAKSAASSSVSQLSNILL
ncbi:hypothetical protein EN829_053220, partial [Mesorhizobium sp. M00.F.Ca.ET.186.01.1.1]